MSTATEQDLNEMTVDELRDRAAELGVDPDEVEATGAGGKKVKADWIRAVEEAEAAAEGEELKNFRFASFENPKTGRQVTKRVSTTGKLSPGNQEATGIEYVEEFHLVRATDRPDALAKIEAGRGTLFRRNGNGEVQEVTS